MYMTSDLLWYEGFYYSFVRGFLRLSTARKCLKFNIPGLRFHISSFNRTHVCIILLLRARSRQVQSSFFFSFTRLIMRLKNYSHWVVLCNMRRISELLLCYFLFVISVDVERNRYCRLSIIQTIKLRSTKLRLIFGTMCFTLVKLMYVSS